MKSRKWRIGSILLAMVILVGTMSSMAFADTEQAKKPDFAAVYQSFISKFAANLGVSEEQVKTAVEATKDQMIDEAVQQGKLTQEQADKMKSNEGFAFFGSGHDRGHGFMGPGGNPEDIANILGITAEQLKTELQSGKKFADIIAEHGITMEQFKEKMQEIRKDAISKAVSDGKLTQEQADKMIQKMEQRINDMNQTDNNN
ncbi:hypothetical protein DCCM_4102 [Desulfocucumis palustris]|uniref:DUF2680 domain-containing protein n=1 Tax=Desulfocucumis palustris TaxID=1898651 RepID=A0A2L2XM03_9FIRM|nr:DUF2680 domain-containing protein [Desulfocucumis palustris]GBF34981.1 hypothetical protein DCCM_4102 [Desulfocucumis palustris]